MTAPDRKITAFIRRHHVLTLATSTGDRPWCANLFYAYIPGRNLFVFTSDSGTKHACEAMENPVVGGSIVLETRMVGKVQGLQLQGVMRPAEGTEGAAAKAAYLKRFPYAAAYPLELWCIEPFLLKLTDNTLGFGKKLIWEKDDDKM